MPRAGQEGREKTGRQLEGQAEAEDRGGRHQAGAERPRHGERAPQAADGSEAVAGRGGQEEAAWWRSPSAGAAQQGDGPLRPQAAGQEAGRHSSRSRSPSREAAQQTARGRVEAGSGLEGHRAEDVPRMMMTQV